MSQVFSSSALAGEIALVTGASRGIGASIAAALADAGASVVGTATSQGGADAISAAIGAGGRGIVLNVAEQESVDAAIKDIQSNEGAPTILVNNAGITRDNLLLRMKPEEWDDVVSTNLTGTFRVSKACLRGMMKARKGRIINIASVIAVMGNAGQSNYAATKAGIVGFTKSLAREIASRGITVNVVAPGFIDTDMTRELPEENRAAMLTQVPLGRLGEGEDIANAILYLASAAGAYITGETLHVNGGMVMD
ncbi:MAG: 3-oxoacyl-ACP reductase FabG [Gammaproteobacteria bacterium]|nr:3-oxoacyl-ACP reductase FabG [Gammaproteobacteria bacterium]NNF48651.1 3-oxoacyl-ACP reductase FabG [Woeseiaceae bacterium]MBT8095252.1 3-oxoacyl-ACP reductase FabG [Gammaproteobacteria bacterium]MBT8105093.1 3-oxoacyl-ACP reductase FabG [Gammaproteobacteria bacterium]NNK25107.1 3-oxoacyl-ACP reductase FabG [Woeseiaceae bacterium]